MYIDIVFTSYSKIRKKDASPFHFQLCLAIFFMLFSFLVGIDRSDTGEAGCTFFSVLIHYFTLTSVFWMAAEALLMGKKLVFDVFGRFPMRQFTILISLLAWGKSLAIKQCLKKV